MLGLGVLLLLLLLLQLQLQPAKTGVSGATDACGNACSVATAAAAAAPVTASASSSSKLQGDGDQLHQLEVHTSIICTGDVLLSAAAAYCSGVCIFLVPPVWNPKATIQRTSGHK
jgi:hypothetical protein